MGALAKFLGVEAALKTASGGPNVSEDGRFAVWPFGWMGGLGWGQKTGAGPTITNDGALGIVSVYACVRVLAESVASLPFIVYRRTPGGGKDRAPDHHLYPVLHDQPNPDMTSFVWRETVMSHLTTWGNSYNEIAYDQFGRLQLWPLNPARVEVKFEGGQRQYDYLHANGSRQRLKPGSVFHIPGISTNGLVGFSPIQLHREALGLYQALQDFGANTMRNNARPALVGSHPKNLSPGAIERLTTQMDKLRGAANAGKTIIAEEGLTWQEIGIPPGDAQYIEGRKFQREEIASMFRIPPHMIGDLSRSTNNNIEHQSLEFVMHSLRPWLVRIEQEVKSQLLFGEPDDVYVEFLVDGLLRGDAKSRAEALAIRWQHGTLTPDEWRDLENENPLPEGTGKSTYVPANYKRVGEEEPVEEPERGPNVIDIASAVAKAMKSEGDGLVSKMAEDSIAAQERMGERFASVVGNMADAMKSKQPIEVDARTIVAEGAVQVDNPVHLPPMQVTVPAAPAIKAAPPRTVRKTVERDDVGRIAAVIEEPV